MVATLDSSHAADLQKGGVFARSFVPGVDRSRFRPRSEPETSAAKTALGLRSDDRCALHVGHLNRQRHLDIMATLASACDARAVMVSGSAVAADDSVAKELLDAGVLLVREDFADIRDAYCAADVYVFPTLPGGGAIAFPLSVLEALSVGIPVVSTPFNDLPRAFPEGAGVHYALAADEFVRKVSDILAADTPPSIDNDRLRSWDEVLEDIVRG